MEIPPPLTPLEIPIKLCTFLSVFGSYRPLSPTHKEISIPSVVELDFFLELHFVRKFKVSIQPKIFFRFWYLYNI